MDLDNQTRDSNEDICDSDDNEEEYDNNKGDDNNIGEKIYRKAWREPTVTAPVINSDVKIGKRNEW